MLVLKCYQQSLLYLSNFPIVYPIEIVSLMILLLIRTKKEVRLPFQNLKIRLLDFFRNAHNENSFKCGLPLSFFFFNFFIYSSFPLGLNMFLSNISSLLFHLFFVAMPPCMNMLALSSSPLKVRTF